jgi:hypothetical protein
VEALLLVAEEVLIKANPGMLLSLRLKVPGMDILAFCSPDQRTQEPRNARRVQHSPPVLLLT